MAEAFARMHGAGLVEPASAGSRPSGRIHPGAIAAMQARGYDLRSHASKSLDQAGAGPWDVVVGMGCGDACPALPARLRLEWEVEDPRHLPPADFNRVRDEIERLVVGLLQRLRAGEWVAPG